MSLLANFRRLVIALVVIGLFAGSLAYAMPASMDEGVVAAAQGQNIDMPCGMMAAMYGTDAMTTENKMPCNTIMADCVKKMACLQTVALPEHGNLKAGPVTFVAVTYPVSASLRTGLTREPELSPPLAA